MQKIDLKIVDPEIGVVSEEGVQEAFKMAEQTLPPQQSDERSQELHDETMEAIGIPNMHEIHRELEAGNSKRVRRLIKNPKLNKSVRANIERILKYY